MEADIFLCKLSSFVLKYEDTDYVEGSSISYLCDWIAVKELSPPCSVLD